MEREVAQLNRLAIGLLFLAAAIGIGAGILALLMGGAFGLTTTVDLDSQKRVLDEKYDPYDDTYVNGSTVLDTVYRYLGDGTTICIATFGAMDNLKNPDISTANLSGVYESYGKNGNSLPTVYVYNGSAAMKDSSIMFPESAYYCSDKSKADVPLRLVNYGKVLGYSENSSFAKNRQDLITYSGNSFYEANLYYDESEKCFRTNQPQVSDSRGHTILNTCVLNLDNPKTVEYVAPGGRFHSSLIKDSTGQILGIAFVQIPND